MDIIMFIMIGIGTLTVGGFIAYHVYTVRTSDDFYINQVERKKKLSNRSINRVLLRGKIKACGVIPLLSYATLEQRYKGIMIFSKNDSSTYLSLTQEECQSIFEVIEYSVEEKSNKLPLTTVTNAKFKTEQILYIYENLRGTKGYLSFFSNAKITKNALTTLLEDSEVAFLRTLIKNSSVRKNGEIYTLFNKRKKELDSALINALSRANKDSWGSAYHVLTGESSEGIPLSWVKKLVKSDIKDRTY